MALVTAARKATAALRELRQAVGETPGRRQTRSGSARALADAIARGQSPELVAALRRALGVR
jgi:hypothetical protein